jgi:putative copper resistance protein D
VEGLILIWLRAAGLAGQALALGGAIFAAYVLGGGGPGGPGRALRRALLAVAGGAAIVAAAQAGVAISLVVAFADDGRWPLGAVLASRAGTAGLIRLAAALSVAWLSLRLYRTAAGLPARRGGWSLLLGASAVLPVTSALVSHSTGGLETRAWLAAVAAIHQTAASMWVGGLVCATIVVARADAGAAAGWLRRFSNVAMASVAALALTGMALSLVYVASPAAAIVTSYGAMVLTKVVLFAALLAMGWLNHRAARARSGPVGPAIGARLALGDRDASRRRALPDPDGIVLRRRLEVEAGLAVVALVLAASIGSTPPAADAATPRATIEEVKRVFTPGWPRLRGPTVAELQAIPGLGTVDRPRMDAETAWSEFGHNISGLFILAMGVLATLEATRWAPWARHWPLLIVGLTTFVAWNLDPEGWQTGRVGFWAHLMSPEVFQHRILLACSALFGIGEWWLRRPHGAASRWRYAFPLVCLVSGTLLLTHVHELGETKLAFLMEINHLILGLVILVVGWARWLELRLPPAQGAVHGRLWGPALAFFGLLLVFYREG